MDTKEVMPIVHKLVCKNCDYSEDCEEICSKVVEAVFELIEL